MLTLLSERSALHAHAPQYKKERARRKRGLPSATTPEEESGDQSGIDRASVRVRHDHGVNLFFFYSNNIGSLLVGLLPLAGYH